MSREIKFEYMLFDKDGNFLVKKDFDLRDIEASYFDMALTMHPNATSENQFSWNYDRDKTVRRQYIGLKDKNGKEIYEGDIVSFFANSLINAMLGEELKPKISTIKWNEDSLAFTLDNGTHLSKQIDDNNFVVIGNVFENPELLNP